MGGWYKFGLAALRAVYEHKDEIIDTAREVIEKVIIVFTSGTD